ncbi:MAG: OOP family OmpA-OmpF porin [Paraglaciecola sp.]|jgi:OOP family OmpA-OmpF porin
MKKTMIAMGLLLASVGAASAASAPEGDKWVGGFVEYYDTDGETEGFPTYFDNGSGLGAEVGFRFKPQWAARLEWSHLNIDATSLGQDQSGNRIGVDALYFLPDDLMYIFGGLKQVKLADSSSMANVGLGKHWAINDKWRVITEIAAYHDFGEGYNDMTFKFGLAYTFGGKTAPVGPKDSDNDGIYDNRDQCANSAPGTQVDSTGCSVDTDGDGVLNSMDQCPDTPAGINVGAKGCNLASDSDQDGVLNAADRCADTPLIDEVDASGCSLFTETEVAVNLRVLFGNNSFTVDNTNDSQFPEFADFMKRYPQTDSVIEGHASAPGEADYNLWISQKRAEAVRQLLIEQYGIDAERLSAKGFGESQLIDTANTSAANKVNRRIEAKVATTKREKILKK